MILKSCSKSMCIYILVAGTVILSSFVSSSARGEIVDRIIAKVNSDVITLSELQDISRQSEVDLTDSTREAILSRLIDRILLVQAARKDRIEIPEAYINLQAEKEIQRIKSNFPKPGDFEAWLAKQNMSEEAIRIVLKERLSQELIINRYLRKNVPPISDEDIRKFKRTNPDDAVKQETVHLKQIFFEIPEDSSPDQNETIHQKAVQCFRELKMGTSFESLVVKYSDDSASKEEGGDLGYIHHGEIMPEIEKLAFSLNEGDFSEPILTERGYHIILVLEKASIREYLFQISIMKYQQDILKKLRKDAVITIK